MQWLVSSIQIGSWSGHGRESGRVMVGNKWSGRDLVGSWSGRVVVGSGHCRAGSWTDRVRVGSS